MFCPQAPTSRPVSSGPVALAIENRRIELSLERRKKRLASAIGRIDDRLNVERPATPRLHLRVFPTTSRVVDRQLQTCRPTCLTAFSLLE
jgi:hypothetical protein